MDREAAIGASRYFKGMQPDDRRLVADLMELVGFSDQETIFRTGDPADAFYLIVDGEVSISIAAAGGWVKKVALLRNGICFGEAALLDKGRRPVTAKAEGRCRLLRLSSHDFDLLTRRRPDIGVQLLRLVGATVVQRARSVQDLLTAVLRDKVEQGDV